MCMQTNWLYVTYLWYLRVIFVVGTYMVIACKNKVAVWWVFHIASHFNHLDPRNAVVPLMMLLTSCNASASIRGVT